jgi:hypothetical protein
MIISFLKHGYCIHVQEKNSQFKNKREKIHHTFIKKRIDVFLK